MFQMAPMHVKTAREVPEYEISPNELDFTQSKEISKVKTCPCLLEIFYRCVIISFKSNGMKLLVLGNLLYGNVAWNSSCGEKA